MRSHSSRHARPRGLHRAPARRAAPRRAARSPRWPLVLGVSFAVVASTAVVGTLTGADFGPGRHEPESPGSRATQSSGGSAQRTSTEQTSGRREVVAEPTPGPPSPSAGLPAATPSEGAAAEEGSRRTRPQRGSGEGTADGVGQDEVEEDTPSESPEPGEPSGDPSDSPSPQDGGDDGDGESGDEEEDDEGLIPGLPG